ncbi:hypothetical protein EMPS_01602 [Entomortierella parvispora]|uniref:SET domain-containing protein n=1 Tax=Entomortierella parvispora TaxID=205924 RepID=A0A9P3H375_9FUNG|nr:hypothetical protein EMPS_01602 [Entomortierella parvispora]
MMKTGQDPSVVLSPLKTRHQPPLDLSLQQQQPQSPVSAPGIDPQKRSAGLHPHAPLPVLRRIPRDLENAVDATKLVERVQTEDRGRIVVAKAWIPSGTLLFEASPHAAVCDSKNRRNRCGFCLGPLNKSWRDEEEEKEVSQQLELKHWLNGHRSVDHQEETTFRVIKDECTGCGEIWYCDPEMQDEGEEEEAEEEGKDIDAGVTDICDMNLEEDDQAACGSRTLRRDRDNNKSKKAATTHRRSCRDQDWESLHQLECGFLKRLFNPSTLQESTPTLSPDHEKAMARFLQLDAYDQDYCRMLIRVLIHRHNELDETNTQDDLGNNNQPERYPKDDELGSKPVSFERVLDLVENREQYPQDRLLGPMTDVAQILDAFQEHLVNYDREQQTLSTRSITNGSGRRRYNQRLSPDELLGLVCKEECNSFGIYDYPNWKPTRPYHDQYPHASRPYPSHSSRKESHATYFDTVRSMTAQEKERYHAEHPDHLLLSPIERDRQRQERILNSPNPKLGYGLGYFIRCHLPFHNHSCAPNLYHVSTNRDRMLFYTARDIAPGEELNITYLEFGPSYRLFKEDWKPQADDKEGAESASAVAARMLALDKRREHLKKHFHFDCGCRRCEMELEWKERLDKLKDKQTQEKRGMAQDIKENSDVKKDQEGVEAKLDNADHRVGRGKNTTVIPLNEKSVKTTLDKNGHTAANDSEDLDGEEEQEQDDKDSTRFLREGLMCQRQIINVQNGRLVDGERGGLCYGFYAPPQVLARIKVDQFKDYKYKYHDDKMKHIEQSPRSILKTARQDLHLFGFPFFLSQLTHHPIPPSPLPSPPTTEYHTPRHTPTATQEARGGRREERTMTRLHQRPA